MIKDDATFKTYTGATASDPRFYQAFTEGEPVVTAAKPGFAVYRFNEGAATQANAGQDGDIPVFVDVFARTDYDAQRIKDRLIALLHEQRITTATKRTLRIVYNGATSLFDAQERVVHEAMTFTMLCVFS